MKLYEALPDRVTLGRHVYRLNLDFRNVLLMLDTARRDDLIPSARIYRALRCVMRHPPRNDVLCAAIFVEVEKLLFSGVGKKADGPKITDFEQDADLIRAAFWQAYRINLWCDRLHWFEFRALLNALPDGSRYSDIVGIRARPIPEATRYNQAEREWLFKAKAACALEMSEEERAASYANGLRAMSESMRALANRGGNNA